MAPPTYGDLGKQARDLFAKNYRKNVCIIIRQRQRFHQTKTITTSDHNNQISTNVSLTLIDKWNTDNTLATEVSLEDQLIKGSKLAFSANFAPQSGKKAGTIKSALKADHFNANADIDFDYGGALFHGSAVLGYLRFYHFL